MESSADVLIVLKGHGGGNWSKIENAKEQAEETAGYYLRNESKTAKPGNKKKPIQINKPYQFPSFNCKKIHRLLNELNRLGKKWVLTDFIHCYIDDGDDNPNKAAEFCFSYLLQIIEDFEPENIVLMGGDVQSWYKKYLEDKLEKEPNKIETHFPSGWAADHWVTQGGVDYILDELGVNS